jgi:hypothetical protein
MDWNYEEKYMGENALPSGILTADDIPSLLILNKRALNREIKKEMRKRRGNRNIWDTYIGIKTKVLQFPGKTVAKLVKRFNKPGGERFCKRVQYCERKAWFKEHLKMLEEISEERMIAADTAAVKIVEHVPDGQELLDTAQEFLEEVFSEAVDYALPVSLVTKIFKYGMDELCDCNKI